MGYFDDDYAEDVELLADESFEELNVDKDGHVRPRRRSVRDEYEPDFDEIERSGDFEDESPEAYGYDEEECREI